MLDDANLKQIVLDELEWDNKVEYAHIGVSTTCGAISRNEHVSNYASNFAVAETSSVGVSISDETMICRREFKALFEIDLIEKAACTAPSIKHGEDRFEIV